MKQRIDASEWVQYNANTRGKHTGDCVARGLSIAFGMDYDEVRKGLNQVRKDRGEESYKTTQAIKEWIRRHGDTTVVYSWRPGAMKNASVKNMMTVAEFADQHPNGVYFCFVIDNRVRAIEGQSNHVVAILDGKVYDSWNSMGNFVVEALRIHGLTADTYELSIQILIPELQSFAEECAHKFAEKYMPIIDITMTDIKTVSQLHESAGGRLATQEDQLTGKATAYARILPEYTKYGYEVIHTKSLIFKLNPRLDEETNLVNLKKRIKQTLYDWAYNLNHEYSTYKKSKEVEFKNKLSKYARQRAVQLPEWTWPLLTDVYFKDGTTWYTDYEVYMEPLPDDPNTQQVHLIEDTLRGLKQSLEDYRTTFNRDSHKY